MLAEELGTEVEIASLPAGDYAVGADTLVERKRVLDLHAAVIKGRLWPQLAKLRAAAAFPYLLVEGTDIDRGPLGGAAIRGVCLAAIDQGIALLRSGQPRDSALWIHRLAVRCQRVEPPAARPAYSQRPKAGGARGGPRRCLRPCQGSRRPRRGRSWRASATTSASSPRHRSSGSQCRGSGPSEHARSRKRLVGASRRTNQAAGTSPSC